MSTSDQLRNELFTCMHTLVHAYHRRDMMSAIHSGQGKLLHILLQADGCNQQELAGYMRIRPASLSELIQKAEAKGLIRRQPNARDKRMNDVFLTDAGRAQAQMDFDDTISSTADIFSVLTEDEQQQLLTLLSKLNAHLNTLIASQSAESLHQRFHRCSERPGHRQNRRGSLDE